MPSPNACLSPAPLISCASRFHLPALLQFKSRGSFSPSKTSGLMGKVPLPSNGRKQATSRLCNVSGFSTELLELHTDEPSLLILCIPGNPGIVSFYKDFVQAMYELLDGNVSITAIGHISHTRMNWEHGKTFSLQGEINHKVYFIEQELQYTEVPIILVGHSIGSYMCLEVSKRFPQQVKLTVGLYPFLTINPNSLKQSMISMTARSPPLSAAVSCLIALLGLFPTWIRSAIVRRSMGPSWSATAVETTCTHLLQYRSIRNVLFLAATEFKKFSEEFDWAFMRRNQNQLAFLFGIDDHWAPLSFYEEVSMQVPGIALSIEREGFSHSFCCTESGSIWVAHHVASLIKNRFPN